MSNFSTHSSPTPQGCHICSSVAVRKFCVILCWWLSSCRRRSWATTTLHREPDMRRYPDPQHLWWQSSFCSCRSQAMEQFTATPQRCWLTIQSVPVVTKDIFVWIVGPRRSVNYFKCTVYTLTYLLTCAVIIFQQRFPAVSAADETQNEVCSFVKARKSNIRRYWLFLSSNASIRTSYRWAISPVNVGNYNIQPAISCPFAHSDR